MQAGRLEGSRILCVRNLAFASNTYICPLDAEQCVIIDPGMSPELIDGTLMHHGLVPAAILCTHGHFDHVGSADFFQKKYGARMYLHRADARIVKSANFFLMASRIGLRIATPVADALLDDGGVVSVGSATFIFHHAPGHTPGSCLVEHNGTLFSGDTIYRDGIGEASLPGDDPARLRASILNAWQRFPDDTVVRPGHGGSASLGEIKAGNVGLRHFLQLDGRT